MEEKDLQLLEESKQYVGSTGKWMKFFAILGCIGVGFLILAAPDFVIGTPRNFRQRVFQWVCGVS